MNFARFKIDQLEGAVLAHGFERDGLRLAKGHRLSRDDLSALSAAGVTRLMAAKLDEDDIGENQAAIAIAAAMKGHSFDVSGGVAGRVNLYAQAHGLLQIDAGLLNQLNGLDEGLAVSTLGQFKPVAPGELIATIKIIPFALPGALVEMAKQLLGPSALFKLHGFDRGDVHLIQTRLPHTLQKILDKTVVTLDQRLNSLGLEPPVSNVTEHKEQALAASIRQAIGDGAECIMIMGASAIVDRGDVVPTAIIEAGGIIDRFGIPVDPGNLLLLARIGEVAVIGLPGCARSIGRNGADIIMERTLAGLSLNDSDFALMGLGGLKKETAGRPQSREATGLTRKSGRTKTAAIVLAAGLSRRMGNQNKLLVNIKGAPMISRTLDAITNAGIDHIYVVTGFEQDAVQKALAKHSVKFVHNPAYEKGLGTSLAVGAKALSKDTAAAFVILGDMPYIKSQTLAALKEACQPNIDNMIVVPCWRGKRGNPVLFHHRFFASLASINGDHGARDIITDNPQHVVEVDVDDPGISIDLDTQAAFKQQQT
jgi:molybdenum cofactor cytidylyltransferase